MHPDICMMGAGAGERCGLTVCAVGGVAGVGGFS